MYVIMPAHLYECILSLVSIWVALPECSQFHADSTFGAAPDGAIKVVARVAADLTCSYTRNLAIIDIFAYCRILWACGFEHALDNTVLIYFSHCLDINNQSNSVQTEIIKTIQMVSKSLTPYPAQDWFVYVNGIFSPISLHFGW